MRTLLLAAIFILGATAAHATIYYVDSAKANNTGTGTSWATAKKDIQNAITLATVAGDEVWVKKGTYTPTERLTGGTSDRDMSFQMANGIKLYGGFAGTENLLTQRNLAITVNRSIMSGDIGTVNDTSDNCNHVIVFRSNITNTTVIDGFTITKGVAGQSASANGISRGIGGGLYISGAPTLSHLIITGNFARTSGGGIYNSGSLIMSDVTVDSNYAYSGGGGLWSTGIDVNMNNCSFTGNKAEDFGGAIRTSSTMTMDGMSFTGNSCGRSGGAILTQGDATITNAHFRGNVAEIDGGAVADQNATVNISNSSFSDNTCGTLGGGAFSIRGDTLSVFSNIVFTRNSSSYAGGAVDVSVNSHATFNNCTFFENTSSTTFGGGGIHILSGSAATINNCILWNNTSTVVSSNSLKREEVYSENTTAGDVQINNSIVRDATGSPLTVTNATLTNCSNQDPMFVNMASPLGADGIGMTSDDGLALQSCSPAINMGITTTPTLPADILGNNRVGSYDIGAYEYQGSPTLPALAAASTSVTANQTGTVTYGSCSGIMATIKGTQTSRITGSTTVKVFVQSTAPAYNSQRYVRRYYDIAPAANANTATADITLYFSQADFTNYNNNNGSAADLPTGPTDNTGIGNLRVTQQHGTSVTGAPGSFTGWGGVGPANVVINPADNNIVWNSTLSRWEVTFSVTGFSGFFVHTGTTIPLPIGLISFSGRPLQAANRLEWAVSDEARTSSFQLERSRNGADFDELGSVATNRDSYVFDDAQPFSPLSYYRLRISEPDGTISYSKTISISRDKLNGTDIVVAPIPATDFVTITYSDKYLSGTEAKVYDNTGRTFMNFHVSEGVKIDVSTWPAGVYVIQFTNGVIKRLVK